MKRSERNITRGLVLALLPCLAHSAACSSNPGSDVQPAQSTEVGREPETGLSVIPLVTASEEPELSKIERVEVGSSTACEDALSASCGGNAAPVLGDPIYEVSGA